MTEIRRHLDARMADTGLAALVRFADVAVTFTAMWGPPSVPVPRPDGSRRRHHLVRLFVPPEHVSWPFHEARSITLYSPGEEPRFTEDFGGVHGRAPDGVTLAWFFVDEPQQLLGSLRPEPLRSNAPAPSSTKHTK